MSVSRATKPYTNLVHVMLPYTQGVEHGRGRLSGLVSGNIFVTAQTEAKLFEMHMHVCLKPTSSVDNVIMLIQQKFSSKLIQMQLDSVSIFKACPNCGTLSCSLFCSQLF